jgi:hypothetical protein
MTEPGESVEFASESPNVAKALPIGASVRVGRLQDPTSIRAELGRLYREARAREGRYPSAITALRLAGVLGALRNALEVENLEKRIAVLEAAEGKP